MSLARTVHTPQGDALRWELKRNCRLTPRQLAGCLALAAGLSALIGLAFWASGYPLVMAFAGVETAALAAALVVHARHARDRETLTLCDGRLTVEQYCGEDVKRTDLRAQWVRVEPPEGDALVALREHGVSVEVGRHLRPDARVAMARELRRALGSQH